MAARVAGIATMLAAVLGVIGGARAAVVADGREWAQPADYAGLTWSSIATVCPVGGGACAGWIGSRSFDGWTWATVGEVGSLFHYFESSFPDNGSASLSLPSPSSIETSFFVQFVPAYDTTIQRYVGGWSATASDASHAYKPFVNDLKNPASLDVYRTDAAPATNAYLPLDGAWLYRSPAVPVPAALTLFASALMAVGASLRRRVNV